MRVGGEAKEQGRNNDIDNTFGTGDSRLDVGFDVAVRIADV